MVTGEFLDVNEKGCEVLGYSREELLPWVLESVAIEKNEKSAHVRITPPIHG